MLFTPFSTINSHLCFRNRHPLSLCLPLFIMSLLGSLVLIVFLSFSVVSIEANFERAHAFIVRVQNDLKPPEFSGVEHWYSSTLRSLRLKSDFIHVYRTVFHGFSAKLTAQQVDELKKRPEILGVFPDQLRQLLTTRSPQFLGLGKTVMPNGLISESDSGSKVIIGVLDTGIWPERRSFHDAGLADVPSKWKGECTEGEKFSKKLCNKKLVGARYFIDGYETIGIASKARIAVYKVCWHDGCADSDILAGIDKAVEDGVDVISSSIGGPPIPDYEDPIAIGAFGAMEHGVFVSAAAGNSGPSESSVTNIAPWITTVGASSIDRRFPADLLLGNGSIINGSSLYNGGPLPTKKLPLIYGAFCIPGSLSPKLVRGKIVLCDRGMSARAAKSLVVKEAGGVGVIVANVEPEGGNIIADAHLIPGLAITQWGGDLVRDYISSTKTPEATIVFRGTQVGVKPAPVVASFSSRGPSYGSPYIFKPDMVAPGVNILAAWPDGLSPTELSVDPRRTKFNILSGTSMSCPHVSGLAALLKGAHPDWSPGAIRSALMTTAYTHDQDGKPLLDDTDYKEATVFVMGAGHVDPEKATDPGLIYNMTVEDYVSFMCASGFSSDSIKVITRRRVICSESQKLHPWDINYPIISVSLDPSTKSKTRLTVTRTVTHVGNSGSKYSVTVRRPKGIAVSVDPKSIEFKKKGEKQSYKVEISVEEGGEDGAVIGSLSWTDGKHRVTSLIVRRIQPKDKGYTVCFIACFSIISQKA
ncbi:unnamed protein product, partial [Vitis vinifera]